MSDETKPEVEMEEEAKEELSPIRIECLLPGYEKDWVDFFRAGWKFKHLRLWEMEPGVEKVVELILTRLSGWNVHDEDGDPILLQPDLGALAFDDLSAAQAGWITGAYRTAYIRSGIPSAPNS